MSSNEEQVYLFFGCGMKKAYIASRVAHKDTVVKEIRDQLSGIGYEISFDWALERKIPEPYIENLHETLNLANNAKRGAMDADVFILVWDERLYGALIELGMFLATSTTKKPKQVFILGEKERICVFELMPEFVVVKNVREIVNILSS